LVWEHVSRKERKLYPLILLYITVFLLLLSVNQGAELQPKNREVKATAIAVPDRLEDQLQESGLSSEILAG